MVSRSLPYIITCAAFLCLIRNGVSALSSPSPLNGYHFGVAATSASRKVTTSNLRQKQPKSYVPDGLTEEQYKQIKNDELAKQQKMNFGMWGPRFNQVGGDPDSNWFNLPSLWMGGFNANGQKLRNTSSDAKNMETAKGIGNVPGIYYLRRYGLAYLMLLISSQLLTRSLSVKKVMSSKWIAVRMILPFVTLKPMSMFASFAEGRQIGWLNKNGTTKLASVMAVLMTILAFVLR